MKKIFSYVLCTLLAIFLVTLLFFFRFQTISSVWKNFRIVAVPVTVGEEVVLSTLDNLGFSEVISASSKTFISKNNMTPYVPVLDSYEQNLSNLFFDKSKNYSVYYLRETKDIDKKLLQLKKSVDSSWRIEQNSNIVYFSLIIPFVLSAIFFIFSKKKFLFLLLQLPFLVFCFTSTIFSSVVVASLSTVVFFYIQYFWQKPGWIKCILTDFVVISFVFLIFVVAVLGGLKGFLLFLCALVSSALVFVIFYWAHKQNNHSLFIFINSAQSCVFPLRQKIQFCGVALVCLFVLSGFFIIKNQFFATGGLRNLTLPVPIEVIEVTDFSINSYQNFLALSESQNTMCNLVDFVSVSWQTEIFPFVTLHSDMPPAVLGSEVVIPSFEYEEKTGTVSVKQKIMYTFDDFYLDTLLQKLENTVSLYVENLLLLQQKFVDVSYKQF